MSLVASKKNVCQFLPNNVYTRTLLKMYTNTPKKKTGKYDSEVGGWADWPNFNMVQDQGMTGYEKMIMSNSINFAVEWPKFFMLKCLLSKQHFVLLRQ